MHPKSLFFVRKETGGVREKERKTSLIVVTKFCLQLPMAVHTVLSDQFKTDVFLGDNSYKAQSHTHTTLTKLIYQSCTLIVSYLELAGWRGLADLACWAGLAGSACWAVLAG